MADDLPESAANDDPTLNFDFATIPLSRGNEEDDNVMDAAEPDDAAEADEKDEDIT